MFRMNRKSGPFARTISRKRGGGTCLNKLPRKVTDLPVPSFLNFPVLLCNYADLGGSHGFFVLTAALLASADQMAPTFLTNLLVLVFASPQALRFRLEGRWNENRKTSFFPFSLGSTSGQVSSETSNNGETFAYLVISHITKLPLIPFQLLLCGRQTFTFSNTANRLQFSGIVSY